MVRRLISLLLAVALLGVAGQGAAYAARVPGPMQSAPMSIAMADCMKMMAQDAPEKTTGFGRHKGCAPDDGLKCMIACVGSAAALPDGLTLSRVTYGRLAVERRGLASPLRGRSLQPDIQPPIA